MCLSAFTISPFISDIPVWFLPGLAGLDGARHLFFKSVEEIRVLS